MIVKKLQNNPYRVRPAKSRVDASNFHSQNPWKAAQRSAPVPSVPPPANNDTWNDNGNGGDSWNWSVDQQPQNDQQLQQTQQTQPQNQFMTQNQTNFYSGVNGNDSSLKQNQFSYNQPNSASLPSLPAPTNNYNWNAQPLTWNDMRQNQQIPPHNPVPAQQWTGLKTESVTPQVPPPQNFLDNNQWQNNVPFFPNPKETHVQQNQPEHQPNSLLEESFKVSAPEDRNKSLTPPTSSTPFNAQTSQEAPNHASSFFQNSGTSDLDWNTDGEWNTVTSDLAGAVGNMKIQEAFSQQPLSPPISNVVQSESSVKIMHVGEIYKT